MDLPFTLKQAKTNLDIYLDKCQSIQADANIYCQSINKYYKIDDFETFGELLSKCIHSRKMSYLEKPNLNSTLRINAEFYSSKTFTEFQINKKIIKKQIINKLTKIIHQVFNQTLNNLYILLLLNEDSINRKYYLSIVIPSIVCPIDIRKYILLKFQEKCKFEELIIKHDLSSYQPLFLNLIKDKPIQTVLLGFVCECEEDEDDIDIEQLSEGKLQRILSNPILELCQNDYNLEDREIPKQQLNTNKELDISDYIEENIDNLDELEVLILKNEKAKELKDLLTLIDPTLIDLEDLISAIKNTNIDFELIAKWYFEKNNLYNFDLIWSKESRKHLTICTIKHWAKQFNPELYDQHIETYIKNKLRYYVFTYDGLVKDSMLANCLLYTNSNKFIFDDHRKCWYEFKFPNDDDIREGEAYKWAEYGNSIQKNLYLAIENNFNSVYRHLIDEIKQKIDEDLDNLSKEDFKKYMKLWENTKKSSSDVFSSNYKNNVIKDLSVKLTKRLFYKDLDRDLGEYLGVTNGVLYIGKDAVKLINYYHELPISKKTTVKYIPYDINNEIIDDLENNVLKGLFKEESVFDVIMKYASTAVVGLNKAPMILLTDSNGSSGKSLFTELINAVLGSEFSQKVKTNIITDGTRKAADADSSYMSLKDKRFAYASESNKGEKINEAMLKDLVSPENKTGRDLHQKQEQFKSFATFIFCTNHEFSITGTDYGIWRRVFKYTFKYTFVDKPKALNEKKIRKDLENITQDPRYLSAMLSIMIKYYHKLQKEDGGDIIKAFENNKILMDEKEVYREKCNKLGKFVADCLVISREVTKPISFENVIVNQYKSWHKELYRELHLETDAIIDDFANVKNMPQFIVEKKNKKYLMKGFRFAWNGAMDIADDEILVSSLPKEQLQKYIKQT